MIYKNIFAGITVGIIALPLSMALAIAVGVPPQNGLYTAIIAGIIASIFGSSKVNISGPTAAFVVILIPIVQEFGLAGLLICGLGSGFILILIGLFKFGKLIELIPYPVTVGFTTGIAVVIAIFQIKDFFGLKIEKFDGHFHEKVLTLFNSFHTISFSETIIGLLTLFILISWSKTKSKIPPALIALSICTVLVYILNNNYGFDISTIKSTFSYDINGLKGEGIPPIALQFSLPWENINFDLFNLDTVYKLLPHSVAIAILGALESLLCAVITDGMTKNNTNPNKELIGQGLANIAVPFFGGIPATAAIARSAANIRSGATGKLSSIVHAIFVLLSILLFAPYLSYLPMASLSALLLVVAWNMSEIKHFINIIKIAPRHDIYVLLTCFILTVFLDMQIAIGVGMGLASILFIKRTIDLYSIDLLNDSYNSIDLTIPQNVSVYSINGPMFFGAAQSALRTLVSTNNDIDTLIIDMKNVPMIDMTGLVAFNSIIQNLLDNEKKLIVCGLNDRIKRKFEKAKIVFDNKNIYNFKDINSAIEHLNIIKE
ncbi:C4-dicarboxylic acid transporter DauA [Halarcobacter anaerophilus]|uniref:C4-dicarboxylic acid transporter DauA n=1 Tax=Halarcobacter anaerophilus TaxID=877500 RepID=UPI0011657CF7|nr:C4-dicarboxylic acid transporter DauA [Halarcobacter anaerophilus]QDF27725.1 sulfate permease [Halarcobacter anaerophilus]